MLTISDRADGIRGTTRPRPVSPWHPTVSLADAPRFCDAMITIRAEAEEIAQGRQPRTNNIFSNAPHTMQIVSGDKWDRSVFPPHQNWR